MLITMPGARRGHRKQCLDTPLHQFLFARIYSSNFQVCVCMYEFSICRLHRQRAFVHMFAGLFVRFPG
jgi:hypothetical protein